MASCLAISTVLPDPMAQSKANYDDVSTLDSDHGNDSSDHNESER